MMSPLRIATRGSLLALWQANHIAELLRTVVVPRGVEIVVVQTTGDRVGEQSLREIGGQGVFTREIQQAVLDGRADLTVHSLKDLPTAEVPGLVLSAVPQRESSADAFLSHQHASLQAVPQRGRIGTGSQRRRAQLLHLRPDLQMLDLRGNVDTRLRKMTELRLDGLILAEAGLKRLGRTEQIRELLTPPLMLPAVGQGALGLECRADDAPTRAVVQRLDHKPSHDAVLAERAFLRELGGGCLLPIGALGVVDGESLHFRGVVLSPDGSERLFAERRGLVEACEAIGTDVADELLAAGARRLLGGHAGPG